MAAEIDIFFSQFMQDQWKTISGKKTFRCAGEFILLSCRFHCPAFLRIILFATKSRLSCFVAKSEGIYMPSFSSFRSTMQFPTTTIPLLHPLLCEGV